MAILAAPLPRLAAGVPAAVEPCLLATLAAMLSADVVVFNDLAPRQRSHWAESCSVEFDCDETTAEEEDPELDFFRWYWSDDHCSYPDRTGDFDSVRILSDSRTVSEWRRSMMYAVLRQTPFIFDRQLMVPLPSAPGHSRRIRFLRATGRDFDDTDRALAALVRPHLVAHLHALDLVSRGIAPLTTRQRQLLSLIDGGYSNASMARTLGISAQTVRTHLQQIYARLGVNSRGEAAALLRPPDSVAALGWSGGAVPGGGLVFVRGVFGRGAAAAVNSGTASKAARRPARRSARSTGLAVKPTSSAVVIARPRSQPIDDAKS